MTEEIWDGSETVRFTEDRVGETFMRINNSNISVVPGSSFKEVVKAHALDAGLGKFRVFLNGEEVKPSQAPELVAEGSQMELRPYDVAGV